VADNGGYQEGHMHQMQEVSIMTGDNSAAHPAPDSST
jgi:hypothetical protein